MPNNYKYLIANYTYTTNIIHPLIELYRYQLMTHTCQQIQTIILDKVDLKKIF